MTLGELAVSITWAFGLVLPDEEVTKQVVNAARHYCAWGDIASLGSSPALDNLDEHTDISDGEWGVIKPLAMLYVERENARALEASRGNGVDVYGRTVSEIDQSITQYEQIDLPRAAFCQMPESI